MAQLSLSPTASLSVFASQHQQQPLQLAPFRAPLCDVATCLMVAGVAGVDVKLVDSFAGASRFFPAEAAAASGRTKSTKSKPATLSVEGGKGGGSVVAAVPATGHVAGGGEGEGGAAEVVAAGQATGGVGAAAAAGHAAEVEGRGEKPTKKKGCLPRGALSANNSSLPATPSGAAVDAADTCVLLVEEKTIRSAYAICMYITSQAASKDARETLLPSHQRRTEQQQEKQQQEQPQNGSNPSNKAISSISSSPPPTLLRTTIAKAAAATPLWVVEDWLAWAAFSFRAAVCGVRKDVLLRHLDLLEKNIGLTLPAMFVLNALRYSFPTSTFGDWPAVSKWLTAVSSLPAAVAASRLVPLPEYPHQFEKLRRAVLRSSSYCCCPRTSSSFSPAAQQPPAASDEGAAFSHSAGSDNLSFAAQEEAFFQRKYKFTRYEKDGKGGGAGVNLQREEENEAGGRICQQQQPPLPLEKYYLTTAINYTNGAPHMGHVYEAVTADVICRYHRIFGKDVYFLTGTDEHGQKIASTAARMQKQPQEICDMYAQGFQELNKKLSISNDFYIRTTMPAHKKICQWLWERVRANGDIYLDTYKGWYNEREETFVSEAEARATDYKDVVSGKPLLQMEEPSYFFRMSKYQRRLVDHIKQNPAFILPEDRRRHILKRLEEPLLDLSCSRNTFSWGVPVPNDEKHVMYVWFDALTNYISALNPPAGEKFHRYWPADLHLIGKDILWFHTVIWPCMLMSAALPLPKSVFGHGFVLAADGEKMSKSLGNVVDPVDVLKKHDADSFRFYLIKEARFGCDLRFEEEGLTACTNADLADTLGNLVHRALSLCVKFCGGVVPAVSLPGATGLPPFNTLALVAEVEACMKQLMLREALEKIMDACRSANKFLTDWAPWNLPDPVQKQQVVRGALEAVFVLAHLLEPFMPVAAARIFEKLNAKKRTLVELSPWFDNLTPGTFVHVGDVLFTKKIAQSAEIAFQKCEVRVGRVVKATPHPHFTKNPSFPPYMLLTIAFSGEKSHSDSQQRTAVVLLDRKVRENPNMLLNRRVLAVCNAKASSFKGVMSQVMVLAAIKNSLKPGDPAVEAELLQLAGDERENKRDLQDTKRECLASETESAENCRLEACADVGALVEAAGYPPVLKNRENVRTAELHTMEFSAQEDKSILLNGKYALRIAHSGAAVQCGPQTPLGKLVLV